MKKKPRPKPRASPPDPLAATFAEATKLIMLGASLYHCGMKQATPTPGAIETPRFTLSAEKEKPEKKGEKLPEV